MIAEDAVDRILRLLLRSDAAGDRIDAEAREILEFLRSDRVSELKRRLLSSDASEEQLGDVLCLIAAAEEGAKEADAPDSAQIEKATAHDTELAGLVISRLLPLASKHRAARITPLPAAFSELPKVDPAYAEHLAADPIWKRLKFPIGPWAERGVTPLMILHAIRAVAMYVDRLTTPTPNWVAWPRAVLLLDPDVSGDAERHRVPRRIVRSEIKGVVECTEQVADALLTFLAQCAAEKERLFDNLVVVRRDPNELFILERDLYAQPEPILLDDVAAYYTTRWGLPEPRPEWEVPEPGKEYKRGLAEEPGEYVTSPSPSYSRPRAEVHDRSARSKGAFRVIAASVAVVFFAIAGIFTVRYVREPQRSLDRLAEMNIRVDEGRVDFPSGASQEDLQTAISLIKGVEPITELDLKGTDVSDLTPLRQLPELEVLGLADTKVADLTPLRELRGLKSLDLDSTPVDHIDPINKLFNLERLNLTNTPITDLPTLSAMGSLQQLDLEATYIKNISPIADLHQLKCLDLSRTEVSNISPLFGLSSLQLLDLRGARVSEEDVEALRQKNSSVEVYLSPSADAPQWHECP